MSYKVIRVDGISIEGRIGYPGELCKNGECNVISVDTPKLWCFFDVKTVCWIWVVWTGALIMVRTAHHKKYAPNPTQA